MKKFILPCLLLWSTPAMADTYAAQVQAVMNNSLIQGPVAWGSTMKEAQANAARACKKRYRGCSTAENSTVAVLPNDKLFVLTCCTQPDGRYACNIRVSTMDENAGRGEAYTIGVTDMGTDGFVTNSCYIKSVYGASSGKKLRN